MTFNDLPKLWIRNAEVDGKGALIREGVNKRMNLQLPVGTVLVGVHKASDGVTRYLFRHGASGELGYLDEHGREMSIPGFADAGQIKGFTAIGNIGVLLDTQGIRYLYFREGEYRLLPSTIPALGVEFGLTKVSPSPYAAGSHRSEKSRIRNYRQLFSPGGSGGNSGVGLRDREARDEAVSDLSDHVFGLLNPYVSEEILEKGYFHQPFFVRYALRLYDGSHVGHSSPVLMLPTTHIPWIPFTAEDDGDDCLVTSDTSRIPYFRLDYRIDATSLSRLQQWKGIVAGLDIFVSAPLKLYDDDGKVEGITSPMGSIHRQVSSGDQPLFEGSYRENPSYDTGAGEYADRYIDANPDGVSQIWKVPANPHYEEDLRKCSLFYRIARIDFDELASTAGLEELPLADKDLRTLEERPFLTDDYRSGFARAPKCIYGYNSRLHAGGGWITPQAPTAPRFSGYYLTASESGESSLESMEVWLRVDGEIVRRTASGDELAGWRHYGTAARRLPRWIYYPDSNAYKMVFRYSDGKCLEAALQSHDNLFGAFCHNAEGVFPESGEENGEAAAVISFAENMICSRTSNPFLFPAEGELKVGEGEVRCLQTAAEPLSAGQFGEYPLYVFTSKGVQAVSLREDGNYLCCRPVCREICADHPGAATGLFTSVAFISEGGKVMLLSGFRLEELSAFQEGLKRDVPLLPRLSAFCGGEVPDHYDWKAFLQGAQLVFDYFSRRLIVAREGEGFVWVMSLHSREWSVQENFISGCVNAYPHAIGSDEEGHLCLWGNDEEDDNAAKILLLTRPFTVGKDDSLHAVTEIRLFGRGAHVMDMALWGSRDGVNWVAVSSGRGGRISTFRGSGYRFFTLAIRGIADKTTKIRKISLQTL